MRESARAVTGLALLTLLVAAPTPPATAGPLDQRIIAVAMTYSPDEATVVQGEVLEFTNLDAAPHDITALRQGDDGRPAFATETIGPATTVVVEGLDELSPGVYDFSCTLHPAMAGTIFLEPGSG